MVQFSFPTSIFEHFELQVARADSDNFSLSPKNLEASCAPIPLQGIEQKLPSGFIHVSSCKKDGQEMWRISLDSLPLDGSSAQLQQPMHSGMNYLSESSPGLVSYPNYSTNSSPTAADWAQWKMPDNLGSMASTSACMNVAPSQLSSPGGSFSNLEQLSNALSQLPLDNSQYAMGGHPMMNTRDYPLTISPPSSTHQDSATHSGISSPSNQSSLSDSGASDDDDPSNSSPTNTFPCREPTCKKTFKLVHARNNHVKRRHSNLRNSSNTPVSPLPRVIHRCTVSECGEQFTRRHDRMRHEWSQHGICSDFSCSHCQRLFSSQNRLDRHYAEKHPSISR